MMVLGSLNKVSKYITLCTDSYSLAEVENLIEVINKKLDLKCYKLKNNNNYRIIIPAYSISTVHKLLATHIPPMMKYKIGL
jgi:LAGLIDADG DNA endonuclease family protein